MRHWHGTVMFGGRRRYTGIVPVRTDISLNQRGDPVNSAGDLVDLGFHQRLRRAARDGGRNAEYLPPTLPGYLPHHYRGIAANPGGHDGS